MKIEVKESYNAVVISLIGEVTGGRKNAEFSAALHKSLDEGKKNVIVDLSETLYMDSSGIGMLISGYTTMKNGGGALKLARLTDKIESLLVITKLNSVFETFDTLDAALKSFA